MGKSHPRSTRICNYEDDTTISVCRPEIQTTLKYLERDTPKITGWFPKSFLKLNEDKCYVTIFGVK